MTEERREARLLDEIARLLAVYVRGQFASQAEAVVAMKKAGIGQTRIAELLGTSVATVNKDLQRAKGK